VAAAPNEPDFGGHIGRTYLDSTPWWPDPPAGLGGPNVVLIVLDDTGFAHFGCYGSELATPHIDELARGGLRYTSFHTTALCSPSRAALLTGRNPHAVGMRGISNWNTGFPHMRGGISPRAATVAELLRDHGYATDGGVQRRRPAYELAAAKGVRPLLRLPARRDRPVLPGAHQRQRAPRSARGAGGRLPRLRGHRGQGDRMDRRPAVHPAGPAVLPVPGVRRHPRAAPVAGRVPAALSPVVDDYASPFPFEGRIDRITFSVRSRADAAEIAATARTEMSRE
jgi:Sulfatase